VPGESWEAAEARRVDGLPEAIGHAPYALQRVNTSTTLGQIVLLHRPARQPLQMPGRYQLVVAAAADTMYTVSDWLRARARERERERERVSYFELALGCTDIRLPCPVVASAAVVVVVSRKVTVTARVAEAAPVAVARAMGRARCLQRALPSMDARLDAAWETMRLAERKQTVVEVSEGQGASERRLGYRTPPLLRQAACLHTATHRHSRPNHIHS
jgi:hypothetical protein